MKSYCFCFNNIIEDYFLKWKTKKKTTTKAKKYYQTNKEKLQEKSREYYKNLTKDEKAKKRYYANNKNKNMSVFFYFLKIYKSKKQAP